MDSGAFSESLDYEPDADATASELRREVAHLRRALADSSLVAARIDRDLRYTWIYNPHPDFDPASVIGKRDDELADNDGIRALVNLKQDVLASGHVVRRTIAFPVSDGYRSYDVRGEPLRNAMADVVGLTTVSLDVTEKLAAEQALERAKQDLEMRVRQRTEQVRSLAKSLSDAEQLERSTIAKSIHDDIQQTLHAMQLHLGLARAGSGDRRDRELSMVSDHLVHAIQVVRNLTKDIDPPLLRPGDLSEALMWLAEHVRERYSLVLSVRLDLQDTLTLTDVRRRMILRTLRELVVNLVTHDDVFEAHLTAQRSNGNLVFEVHDGAPDVPASELFAPDEGKARLETMRERMSVHDGSLELLSTPEGRKVARLVVPLPEQEVPEQEENAP